jgi:hypothetical protein
LTGVTYGKSILFASARCNKDKNLHKKEKGRGRIRPFSMNARAGGRSLNLAPATAGRSDR